MPSPITKLIQRIDVFVSSPSDVSPERELVARVLERLNRLSFIRERYYFRLMAYERSVPPVVGTSAQEAVDDYMLRAKDSDILVCILWARMGTPVTDKETGQRYQSGTEYEFKTAYEANQKLGKPYILLYQKVAAPVGADPDQNAKVNEFFRQFEGESAPFKGLYQRFTSAAQFEEMLFDHLEQVISRQLIDTSAMIDFGARPQIQEETRRLDAAMPDETKVGRATEVWVQICIPASEGFRSRLPSYIKTSREQITQRDVRAGNLAVAFPVDSTSGRPAPIRVTVEINADDFTIEEPHQEIMLSARVDSGLLIFKLTPKVARERGIVHVRARQRTTDGATITLGSTALSTRIHGANAVIAAAQIAWNLLSIPLAAVELNVVKRRPSLEDRMGTDLDDPFGLEDHENDDLVAKAPAIRTEEPTEARPAPPPPEPKPEPTKPVTVVPVASASPLLSSGESAESTNGSRREALDRLHHEIDARRKLSTPPAPSTKAPVPNEEKEKTGAGGGQRPTSTNVRRSPFLLVVGTALILLLIIMLVLISTMPQDTSPASRGTPTDVIF